MARHRLTLVACVIGVLTLTGGARAARTDTPSRTAPFTFRLTDTAGVVHTERELASASAVVLFFLAPECPISQGYVPEMNRIAQAYAARDVRVFGVQSDPAASDPEVSRHVAEYKYRFPILKDHRQLLVDHAGATVTPEAVLMTRAGALRYRGRIDNRIVSLGVRRPQATQFDLRSAVDAVLAGHATGFTRTTAIGCSIVRVP
jgi:peroxiredoxin